MNSTNPAEERRKLITETLMQRLPADVIPSILEYAAPPRFVNLRNITDDDLRRRGWKVLHNSSAR